jgi:putative FmdB family regulatory protein
LRLEVAMPYYEFRCRTCDGRFELRRPMADADATATCPAGHDDVVRLLPAFSTIGSAAPTGCGDATACCGGLCAAG